MLTTKDIGILKQIIKRSERIFEKTSKISQKRFFNRRLY